MSPERNAFILRITHTKHDGVQEALERDEVMIGWSRAQGLLHEEDWYVFRQIMKDAYHPGDKSFRGAGAAGGHMWRFLRDMKPGDRILVPHGSEFFVAEVAGPARYDASKVEEDTAFRRPVRWLNAKRPIARSLARAALLLRMKARGTTADATDLIGDIEECLKLASRGEAPTFASDLEKRLKQQTLDEILTGRITDYGFERLVRDLLTQLGAHTSEIVARSKDMGVDVKATFRVAGVVPLVVGVQAKHYKPEYPIDVEVVDQLVRGIEAEGDVNVGMIVTSGRISEEAREGAGAYTERTNIPIQLVEGDELATLVVEYGLPRERE